MQFEAGVEIRNVEGTSGSRALKKYHRGSWIQVLKKHAPDLDTHNREECAAYERGFCKLGKSTLSGCHCKIGRDPRVYIIPMCTSHNNVKVDLLRNSQTYAALQTSGKLLKSTRRFPAFPLELMDAGREAVVERAAVHLNALIADIRELESVDEDAIKDLEQRIERLLV